MNIRWIVVSIGIASLLLGCASRGRSAEDSTAASGGAAVGSTAAGVDSGVGPAAVPEAAPRAAGPSGGLLDRRVVYFDFDRAEVRADDLPVVQAHARWLASNPQQRVRLEGHADERGSREYNIGLGERRAQAVRQQMMLQGVADAQLSTVSFGEERPAVAGDDEAAYARNRRVEFVYTP
ncbi:MAG: peptidoglycan-associated lipoprotein Pal [Steroidobacteraceae bacterium]|nr:peptidoglycan-associated lipoprotein Pal [Steroidobacteraceae bacterium]MDW8259322.1 peptidoglycan-associated lipoprotein Pal [Gammaproteobacteria bacterium]